MRMFGTDIRVVVALSLIGVLALAFSPESTSAETVVIAYCQRTKTFGISSDDSESKATETALRHCNASGGDRVTGCCTVVGTADSGCIALAIGPTGEHGVETGDTQIEAISAAVEACPESKCVAKTARCVK
jgi:hypothetical protein